MDIDAVIEKIKRCARLANKTDQAGERAAAMNAARRLAEANGLALEEIEDEAYADRAVMVDDTGSHRSLGSEFGFICYILEKHFGVICMLKRRSSRKWSCSYSWFGSVLNIDIARHIQHVLAVSCSREWKSCEKIPGLKRKDFMRGFFWQIDRKLTENPIRNDIEVKQDIAAARRRLIEYKKEHDVKERNSAGDGKFDPSSVLAGMNAAKAVNLNRPCEGRGWRRSEAIAQTPAIEMK